MDWVANLLQGAVSAIIGGVVAAVTAWGVVAATRRHERRLHVEHEARMAAIDLFVLLANIDTRLRTEHPQWTKNKEWATVVLRAEIAFFSLDGKLGAAFSQEIGDLRRTLEVLEGSQRLSAERVAAAAEALRKLTDHLADWLMQGKHRTDNQQSP